MFDKDLPLPCIQLQEEGSSGDEALPRLQGGTKGEKENVKYQFEFLAAVARNGRVWFSFQTTSDTVKQLINLLVDQKLIQMDWSRLGDRAVAETSRSFSVLLTDWKGIIVFVLAESEE